jgi:hypothetical protein
MLKERISTFLLEGIANNCFYDGRHSKRDILFGLRKAFKNIKNVLEAFSNRK